MLIFGDGGHCELVCTWAGGARRARLEQVLAIVHDLVSEHAALQPLLAEPLFAGPIGTRFVAVAPWYQGTTLSDFYASERERTRALDEAFNALMLLHGATVEPHRFSEEDFRAYVGAPIGILASSPLVPGPSRKRLLSLAGILKTLIGEAVPGCVSHGDFELGNLLRQHQGGLRVLDWELSERHGLCLMDLVHLLARYGEKALMLSYGAAAVEVFGKEGTQQSWSAPYLRKYEAAMGVNPEVVRRLAALTTLHDAASYLLRVPYFTQSSFWADYVDAADRLLHT
jgi:aminoglycoside phosphotransferase (APT) family kinase protein